MGLDMYLHKRTYVGNKYRKPEQMLRIKYPANEDGVTFPAGKSIDEKKISSIIEDVAYWRKANQIHNWFVQNVQEGVDDCKEYYVETSQLEELVNLCKKVLSETKVEDGKVVNGQRATEKGWEDILEDGKVIVNPEVAEELLPTGAGFFFGNTGYNQYYLDDLKETIEQLEPYIKKDKDGNYINAGDFYYQSSW